MRRFALPIAFLAVAVLAGPVSADSLYHTERLALVPVAGSPGHGMVVNIHPNGPNVFARELYSLKGAGPDQSYQIHLRIWPDNLSCSGTPTLDLSTAVVETNVRGNGTAAFVLRPGDVPGFLRDSQFSINWIAEQTGTTRYATDCTVVTLD
jgi:hypothetical protein